MSFEVMSDKQKAISNVFMMSAVSSSSGSPLSPHSHRYSTTSSSSSNSSASTMRILANERAVIFETCPNVESVLSYKHGSLRGEFIGVLMTTFMDMLHRRIFVEKYKSATPIARARMNAKLSNKTADKRPLLLFDALGRAQFVDLNLTSIPIQDLEKYSPVDTASTGYPEDGDEYFFELFITVLDSQSAHLFLFSDYYANRLMDSYSEVFRNTKRHMVVICVDFVGSTDLLVQKGAANMAFLNKSFFDASIEIIKSGYYPWIAIHEIIGDSFVYILNADWMYACTDTCAILTMNFLQELWLATRTLVPIRVGVSYGQLLYGLIGNTLRLFGNPMHEAARLEGQCAVNEVIVEKSFHEKLRAEIGAIAGSEMVETVVTANTSVVSLDLKGYGLRECAKISLQEDKDLFIQFDVDARKAVI